MADVYRGTDRVLDRQVAVKVLRELTENESDRERFVAEAKTLAKLNHAGLVTVLDAGAHVDRPFLVMELIDGPNLAECCDTVMHVTRVVAVGTQVADALAHAHAIGVVHRHVKPSNIMLGKDGRVCLTDFGIARLLGDTGKLTRTGMTLGSPAYLSPEQVRGQEVTPAADVYSLGLVLIEMLSGERAYPQSSTEAALARLTSPPQLPDGVSQGWRSLLTAMTALDPEARPTAQQVATTLRELAEGLGPTAVTPVMAQEADPTRLMPAPHTALAPTPASTVEKVARGRLAAAAAAAVVVVALGAALLTSLDGDAGDSGSGDVPAGVPAELERPLGDLHDAVNGGGG